MEHWWNEHGKRETKMLGEEPVPCNVICHNYRMDCSGMDGSHYLQVLELWCQTASVEPFRQNGLCKASVGNN
jgi:hypothetical protein